MKQLIILLAVFLFFVPQINSQIRIDKNTIILDEAGNRIPSSKFGELSKSEQWSMEPNINSEGKLIHILAKKLSAEDKKVRQSGSSEIANIRAKTIGSPAPYFAVEATNGKIISSDTTKEKIVVLNFWFTSCMPCIQEIPHLNDVYETYKDNKDVVFASITFNRKEQVAIFLEKHPISYPVVVNNGATCNLFNPIGAFPVNVVIDKNGNYYDYVVGGTSGIGRIIKNSIENALAGKKPIVAVSK